MFYLTNNIYRTCNGKKEKITNIPAALDTISAIALLIVSALILSGIIHVSPTVANVMLPLAGFQAFIFICGVALKCVGKCAPKPQHHERM